MKRQLLIFDLDGTLADTRADLASAMNRMRAHYGLPPFDLDTAISHVGGGIRNLVLGALQGASVDFEEALALNKKCYAEHLFNETALYPGVERGLATLAAAGHSLAVLSNKPGELSREILRHFNLDRRFFRMIGGGDVPQLKPAPDGIDALLGESGIDRGNSWMIGDHHTDLEVAQHAGVQSGFVTYGIGHPGEFAADQVWSRFDELVEFFINK